MTMRRNRSRGMLRVRARACGNDMRVFQEEIFGPVVVVTSFRDEAEARALANDTEFGLGAGVWTRDTHRAYRMGGGIEAGRV